MPEHPPAPPREVDRFRRLEELFFQAEPLDEDARQSFLNKIDAQDAELGAELRGMLGLDSDPSHIGAALAAELGAWQRTEIPPKIGSYRVVGTLGRGGLGEVYAAYRDDGHFQQQVAVKWVRPDLVSQDLERRLRHERQILATLKHPNIARIFDGGSHEGSPYIVMERIDGSDLLAACGGMPVRRKLQIFIEVCDAVQFAHQNLILHCDLKPSNILVDGDGHPKLLDFGIAKALRGALPELAAATLTQGGSPRPFTPAYASPEQVRFRPLTTATDIYSLGVVLYELLSGRKPYQLDTFDPIEIAEIVGRREPPAPRAAFAEHHGRSPIPWGPDLDAIVAKSLRKESEHRYRSAEQLAEDLRRYLDFRPVTARRGSVLYRWKRWIRRHRWAVAAVSAIFITLTLAFGATWLQRQKAEDAGRRAEGVKQFLIEVLKAADPDHTPGYDPTPVELLQDGALRIDTELRDQPVLAAELRSIVGSLFRITDDFDAAEAYLTDAHTGLLATVGPEAPLVLRNLQEQSLLDLERDRFSDAGDKIERALEDEARLRGTSSRDYGAYLRTRASILVQLQDYGDATSDLDAAAVIAAAFQDGKESAEILDLQTEVALREGRYQDAVDLAKRSLGLWQNLAADKDSTRTARALNNVGATLYGAGRRDEGAEFLEEGLAMRRRLHGERPHGSIALSCQNLANLYISLKDYDKADELLQEAHSIVLALSGPDGIGMANVLALMGRLELGRGNYSRAEELYGQAHRLYAEDLPPGHVDVMISLQGIGDSRRRAGKSESAADIYRQILDIQQRHPPADPIEVAYTWTRLGLALCDTDPQRGSQAFERSLELKKKLGRPATSILVAEARLAHCRLQIAPNPESELERLRESRQKLQRLNPEHTFLVTLEKWLAVYSDHTESIAEKAP